MNVKDLEKVELAGIEFRALHLDQVLNLWNTKHYAQHLFYVRAGKSLVPVKQIDIRFHENPDDHVYIVRPLLNTRKFQMQGKDLLYILENATDLKNGKALHKCF